MAPAILLFIAATVCVAANSAGSFNGRWDITVPKDPRARAWWLEVTGAGTSAVQGRFVGAPGGQLDVIPRIRIHKDELEFIFDRRYLNTPDDRPQQGIYRAKLVGGKLVGTFDIEGQPDRRLDWIGVRAPAIDEVDDGSWKPGKPVEVFNGKDLAGWHSRLPNREIGWRVTNGILNNGNAGVPDLVTDAKFWNFALHVEYRIGKGSNSGVGLRGRYEVQIIDDYGRPPSLHGNGALYSRIAPSKNASRPPGEWQTLDIRLVGRIVTVVLNDEKIIDHQVIEGLTAIASDPNEGQPGPLILQGDHGPVEFRNITLTPLTR
jgi:hypothetical protein